MIRTLLSPALEVMAASTFRNYYQITEGGMRAETYFSPASPPSLQLCEEAGSAEREEGTCSSLQKKLAVCLGQRSPLSVQWSLIYTVTTHLTSGNQLFVLGYKTPYKKFPVS